MFFKFFLRFFGIQQLSARQMVDEALRQADGCDVGACLTIIPEASGKGGDFVIVGPDGDTHRLPVKSTGVAQLIALWSASVDHYREQQANIKVPEAFIDSQGFLRHWKTANPVSETWVGIAADSSKGFLAVCRSAGRRSIHKLRASSLAEARREVALTMCFAPTSAA